MLEETSVTKLYYNESCSKCREALCLLEDRDEKVTLVEYMKAPMAREELQELVNILGIKPFDLVRVKEEIFINKFSKRSKTKYDWIGAMIQYPQLMERPIIIKNKKAVIGRPPVLVLDVL